MYKYYCNIAERYLMNYKCSILSSMSFVPFIPLFMSPPRVHPPVRRGGRKVQCDEKKKSGGNTWRTQKSERAIRSLNRRLFPSQVGGDGMGLPGSDQGPASARWQVQRDKQHQRGAHWGETQRGNIYFSMKKTNYATVNLFGKSVRSSFNHVTDQQGQSVQLCLIQSLLIWLWTVWHLTQYWPTGLSDWSRVMIKLIKVSTVGV